MKIKTNNIWISGISALIMSLLTTSCGGNASLDDKFAGDTVVVQTVKQSDTTSFVKANGEKCVIIADATIDVPVKYGTDEETLVALKKLFVKHLLDAGDSLQVEDAIKHNMGNTLKQYEFADAPADTPELEEEVDHGDASQLINNSVNITVDFNKYNLITFCKVEVFKKDGVVTSVSHRYFTFDLESKALVEASNIFKEDAISEVREILKSQLLQNNKVSNDDQLNEIGFFNVDNLNVSNNFFFTEKGITWSYLPNELAVEALGEPQVALEYDVLEPYMSEKSVIKRFYK